jgi:Zn finger protein HypA/HybF involved in hydrogenase expression
MSKSKVTDDVILAAALAYPSDVEKAYKMAKVSYYTFVAKAARLGITYPKRGQKGWKNPNKVGRRSYPLESILSGEQHWNGGGPAMKVKLIDAGLKEDRCECCGSLPLWQGKPLTLQLDHIDGNHYNWKLENLRILCPNCHTQTVTYGNTGQSPYRSVREIPIEEIIEACAKGSSVTEVARILNINFKSAHARRVIKTYFHK